jgi:hypothetical protein
MTLCGKDICPGENCEECRAICDAAAINALNFGVPERLGCQNCGYWYKPEDFIAHLPCDEDA